MTSPCTTRLPTLWLPKLDMCPSRVVMFPPCCKMMTLPYPPWTPRNITLPIRAAGDGKVMFRGVQGGYGNVIILQHGGNITTLYGHMSRFGSQRVGSRVVQGEVIGYVGQSGLATGPHLHYEYRVNGVHRNPRTVSLPPADPVPAEYQEDFRAATASLWRQLDLYDDSTSTAAVN